MSPLANVHVSGNPLFPFSRLTIRADVMITLGAACAAASLVASAVHPALVETVSQENAKAKEPLSKQDLEKQVDEKDSLLKVCVGVATFITLSRLLVR